MRKDDREEQTTTHKKYGKYSQKRSSFAWRILPIVQVIITVVLVVQISFMGILPTAYLAGVIAALVVLALIPWILTSLHSRASKIIGTVIAGLVIIVLALGAYYLYITQSTLEEITQTSVVQTDDVVVVVLTDSEYETLSDLDGRCVGVQKALDRENTDKVLEELDGHLTEDVSILDFEGMGDMVEALYDGEADAIIFNESYREMITDEYEDFDEVTRVLDSYTYETEVEMSEGEKTNDVTTEPFILYFSGIDTYGTVAAKSRSDVNILAVVNPVSKQVLLVTTPRDYYVELPFADYALDKLTHTGIYGIDRSIETLEYLYGFDIDYYLRLNFTGFMEIVDALGGVTVYSESSFTSSVGKFQFSAGYNEITSGEMALGFVRERHSFGDGDFQRARNQMAMIEAIMEKVASPSILGSYTTLLDSLQDSFTTNMSTDEIVALVKMQLEDNAEWDIQTYSVVGEGARRTTYSMGSTLLYVTLQDEDSLNTAKELVERVKNGEKIDANIVGEGSSEEDSDSEDSDYDSDYEEDDSDSEDWE